MSPMEASATPETVSGRPLSVAKGSKRKGKSSKKSVNPVMAIVHAADPCQFRSLVQELTGDKPLPVKTAQAATVTRKETSRIQRLAPEPILKPPPIAMSKLVQPVARDGRVSPLSSPGLAIILNSVPKDSGLRFYQPSQLNSSTPSTASPSLTPTGLAAAPLHENDSSKSHHVSSVPGPQSSQSLNLPVASDDTVERRYLEMFAKFGASGQELSSFPLGFLPPPFCRSPGPMSPDLFRNFGIGSSSNLQ